jgi:hypothetical protein
MSKADERATVLWISVAEIQWVAGTLGTLGILAVYAWLLDWRVLLGLPLLWLLLWGLGFLKGQGE